MRTLCCTLFALSALWGLTEMSVSAASTVYISVSEENRVAQYSFNDEDGSLSFVASYAVEGAPGAIAVSPDRKLLFVSLRTISSVASFQIDPESGKLAPIATVPAGANMAYIRTDRTGQFLFGASYSDGKVTSHRILPDGRIGEKPISLITTAKNAHCIMPDPSNRFVFVPHTGPNAIYQFKFDVKTGILSANDPPTVTAAPDQQPRHLAFHPAMDIAYVDNEKESSCTLYRFDKSTGTLTAEETHSTLPQDFKENNSNAEVLVTPNGRFVYVSNRGHDSLAGFAIDKATGKLKPLGQTPTEKTPRAFAIHPSGKWLLAAGQGNGKLAAYALNDKTGELTRIGTYEVGKSPAWVTIVEPRAKD